MEPNVRYIAVARPADSVIIGSFSNDKTLNEASRAEVPGLLKYTSYYKATSTAGLWVVMHKNFISYLVLVKLSYPERHANGLLRELQGLFEAQGLDVLQKCGTGAFSRLLSPELKRLLNKYEDIRNIDKVYAVSQEVDQAKSMASAGIRQVLQNTAAAGELVVKTNNMEINAKLFHDDTRTLQRGLLWRRLKIYGLVGFIVLCIIFYIILSQ